MTRRTARSRTVIARTAIARTAIARTVILSGVPTLLLIRHGRTSANASGILAGWLDGVGLDEAGGAQAARLSEDLGALPVCRVLASPLPRTLQTATPLAQRWGVPVEHDAGLGECRYGAWTGRPLSELAHESLWQTVQRTPSAAHFPPSEAFESESLAQMSARAVEAVRRTDAEVAAEHGPAAVWAAVSHGDVIKAIVADALGLHLDQFQRIVIDPASVSVIRYPHGRPLVLRVNGPGVGLEGLVPASEEAASDEGAVGGGAGAPTGPGADQGR